MTRPPFAAALLIAALLALENGVSTVIAARRL